MKTKTRLNIFTNPETISLFLSLIFVTDELLPKGKGSCNENRKGRQWQAPAQTTPQATMSEEQIETILTLYPGGWYTRKSEKALVFESLFCRQQGPLRENPVT